MRCSSPSPPAAAATAWSSAARTSPSNASWASCWRRLSRQRGCARSGASTWAARSSALARVRAAYARDGLVWTAPLGFDNSFALVVRPDVPARTISDAVPLAREWTAAFGYEFQQRADGYPALARVYGIRFREVRTMDLGLLYRALADRQVDLVVGSATDGPIARLGLRVLEDDRHAFAPYEAVPVVRATVLHRYPQLAAALAALGGTIDVAAMRRMNAAVDDEHRDPAAVVRAFREAASLRRPAGPPPTR